MCQDPALSPTAQRDAAYSLDKLRYEETERYKEEAVRQRQIANLLVYIRALLVVIAALLAYIGWRLTN